MIPSTNQGKSNMKHLRMKKNVQKFYAGFMGCSGVPLGEDQKYSAQDKSKRQKYQVYKMNLNTDKVKVSYHK